MPYSLSFTASSPVASTAGVAHGGVPVMRPRRAGDAPHIAAPVPVPFTRAGPPAAALRELILVGGADILRPDPAICGGITAAMRIAVLASAHLRTLAPHVWGSAVLFADGLGVGRDLSQRARIGVPAGRKPVLAELVDTPVLPMGGQGRVPGAPGSQGDHPPRVRGALPRRRP